MNDKKRLNSYEDLPLVLDVADIQWIMGISWYVTIRAWNQTSKDKSRAYSPYSTMKKFKTKK